MDTPRNGAGDRINDLSAQLYAWNQGHSGATNRISGLINTGQSVVVGQCQYVHSSGPGIRNQFRGRIRPIGIPGVRMEVDASGWHCSMLRVRLVA